jgi:hypothetical protein
MSNITSSTNPIDSIFELNRLSGSVFGIVLLLTVFYVMFNLLLKNMETTTAALNTSIALTLLFSIILWVANIVSGEVVLTILLLLGLFELIANFIKGG